MTLDAKESLENNDPNVLVNNSALKNILLTTVERSMFSCIPMTPASSGSNDPSWHCIMKKSTKKEDNSL